MVEYEIAIFVDLAILGILVFLKIVNIITFSWIWVLSPLWLPIVAIILIPIILRLLTL
jgi:hypothetical protein